MKIIQPMRQSIRRRSQSPPKGDGAAAAAVTTNLARSASQQQQFNHLIGTYLDNVVKTKDAVYELEVRFGTIGVKYITRNDYENVIEKLRSAGYVPTRVNNYHLRMQCSPPENEQRQAGRRHPFSNIRVEVNGLANIQEYCRTDMLNRDHTVFNMKDDVWLGDGGASAEKVQPIIYDDFNFKVSLQKERRLRYESREVTSIAPHAKWAQIKKTFRYLTRTSFELPNMPIRIDVSVVKESHREQGSRWMKPEYSFANSKVTESPLKYEIEIEVLNDRVGPGKFVNSTPALAHILRGAIKLVLTGLQNTNYPVPYPELQVVCNQYHHLLFSKDRPNPTGDDRVRGLERDERDGNHQEDVYLKPRDFIGPSSVTLQISNVADIDNAAYNDQSPPNIRFNYTVTEKADGQRKMLFVNRAGRMYLIDMAMNVQFTGAVCIDDKLHGTLIDGEHIMHDKTGSFINLYAAFDIYYIRKIDIRHLALAAQDAYTEPSKTRLYHLQEFMRDAATTFRSVVATDAGCPIRLVAKRFEVANVAVSGDIFRCCAAILDREHNGSFEYHTDGLVFTPANTGVGVSRVGQYPLLQKTTWARSFKWKPTEHNTIDFLVTTEKTRDQNDIVVPMRDPSSNSDTPVTYYKTLTLRVGYSVKMDGYLNPMNTVIEMTGAHGAAAAAATAANAVVESDRDYVATPFYPTTPSDISAHVCNIRLHLNASGVYEMQTENGEAFSDRTVVEFRYDGSRDPGWRWIPIKVRHDKTLRRELGNSFRVANDNWFSIHNPVTHDMLRSGDNVPGSVLDTDAYYDRSAVVRDHESRLLDTSTMQPLRDFHNLFVKRSLIAAACKPGDTLIDLAVGKAGDLSKWAHSELEFVLGIDISDDNINNRHDGAYARYLNLCSKKTVPKPPYTVFVRGDSGKLLRTGETDAYRGSSSSSSSGSKLDEPGVYKAIASAIFGEGGEADPAVVGHGVMQRYAIGKDGFNTCSVQFAVHYFWKDVKTLHTFLRNVSECTKVGGHFIGTCYNGERVYKLLTFDKARVGEGLVERDGSGRVVWSLTRQYSQTSYLNDESSVGYAIDVFQESINKTHREYLVNMVYLTRLMENYGFELASKEDARRDYHLPNSMGSFREMFEQMTAEIAANPETAGKYKQAPHMNGLYHKTVSFIHNYFIFKKRAQVNAKQISEAFIKNEGLAEALQAHLAVQHAPILEHAAAEVAATAATVSVVAAAEKKPEVKPRKYTKKVKLVVFESGDASASASASAAPVEKADDKKKKRNAPKAPSADNV